MRTGESSIGESRGGALPGLLTIGKGTPGRYARRVRSAALALVVAALAVAVAGCGPLSPTEAGGADADPLALLDILPSPGALRGPPAAAADADALQVAFTGTPDPDLAGRIRDRAPKAAAVRSWTGPDDQTLTIAVSVWNSHLIATGIGSDLAGDLVSDGGDAWTPEDAPGSRGAKREGPPGRELRLARSVGPNSLYVRATGPVPEETVIRALERMTFQLQNGQNEAG